MSVGSERDRLVTGPSATRRQAVAAAVAGLSSLTVGLSCGFSSPTIPQLEAEGLLTTAGEVSWFASILLVGALAGAGLGAVLVERLGRKGAVLSGGLPSAVGWCLLASGAGPARLLAGRVLAGLGVGVVSVSVPLYTAEIATPALRGRLASLHPIGIALGMMLSYGGSMLLPWRWLAVAGGAVTTAAVTLMAGVPESPTWLLASYDDDRQAALALRWLRGGLRADIEHEMYELHAVAAHSHRAATLRELVSERALYRPVLVGVAILTLQQFSGINAIMFYAQNIFRSAGFSSGSDAATPALVVAAIQVIVTAASSVFIDHVGRRPLLILGGCVMCVSSASCGIYYYVTDVCGVRDADWLAVASLVGVVVGFSIGWGPVPWLITSEVLPVRVKGIGTGLANAGTNVAAFLITKEFGALQELAMPYGAFWIFAGFAFVGIVFGVFVVPETKGRSLYQIQQFFS